MIYDLCKNGEVFSNFAYAAKMWRLVIPLLISITHVCFVFAGYDGKCKFINGNVDHEALNILNKLEGKTYVCA